MIPLSPRVIFLQGSLKSPGQDSSDEGPKLAEGHLSSTRPIQLPCRGIM